MLLNGVAGELATDYQSRQKERKFASTTGAAHPDQDQTGDADHRRARPVWKKGQNISLARLLHEGFGIQGVTGKADGAIGRTGIAIAMAGGGSVQLRSPARPETEQDTVCLCDTGQAETSLIISTTDPRQERSAFMQHAG